MKLSKLLFAIAACVGFVASGFAQNIETNKHGILGYLDPKTGTFRPLTREARPASIAPIAGTFVFDVTITVSSSAPKGPISCYVTASVTDALGSFFNDVQVPASVTANTATCKITMPYEWYLKTPSTDHVYVDLSVTTGSATSKEDYYEDFDAPLLTLDSVPANGSTTTETYTTTI